MVKLVSSCLLTGGVSEAIIHMHISEAWSSASKSTGRAKSVPQEKDHFSKVHVIHGLLQAV